MKYSIILLLVIIFSLFVTVHEVSYASYYGPKFQGRFQGELPSGSEVCISVFIPPKNMNYLYLIVQEIYNHQMRPLNRSELVSLFGNLELERQVVSFLSGRGFTIVYKSPFSVMALSNASLVESVFQTSLSLYKTNDMVYYRPSSAPIIPQQLQNTMIMGLTNYTLIRPDLQVLGNLTSNGIMSSGNYYGFQFSANYYTGKEIQQAYNVTPGGKNVTVAVVDAYGDPELVQDLQAFDKLNDLPPVNLTVLPIGPYHPIYGLLTGWDTETALDVETVHSMAPYAHVLAVVTSNAGSALYEGIDLIVSQDLANVVSMSWGLPENVIGSSGFYAYYLGSTPNYPYLDYYFALGSAEGISFFASSGDNGAFGGTLSSYGGVNFPASSPFVTAVGGTSLYLNVKAGSLQTKNASVSYGYETAWGVLPQYFEPGITSVSSGGGESTLFPAPWYQMKYLNATYREVPDVSADANPYTGMVIVSEGAQEVIGGTSLASPIWAGVTADLDSQLNESLGLINPMLYWIYSNKSLYSEAFHQIELGFNGVYSAKTGYNMVTGLGSPNYPGLLMAVKQYLSQKELTISVTTSSPNTTYPWYSYGSSVNVVAYITTQKGDVVKEGNFNAYVYTLEGFLEEIPLKFNGTYWTGEFEILRGQPSNVWSIIVNGTSNNLTGVAQVDIDVGNSLVIIQPTPFPYNSPLPINEPIPISVQVSSPNGTPLVNESVFAYLIKDNKVLLNVTLLPSSTGLYSGQFTILPNMPQGTYLLEINSTEGSVYTYLYVGSAVYGTVYPPINDGFPGVANGENVSLFAEVIDTFGLGLFSSNVTAYIYQGDKLVAQVPMVSAPDVVQYGVFNLFGLKEANFTIPYNFTPGLYKVVFHSVTNTSVGLEFGNFTTWFYVSPSLEAVIQSLPQLYQGENVPIKVKISYSNGTPVTQGEFSLTLIPAGTAYQSLIEESEYEIPLQYNSTLGLWVGNYTVPFYLGNEQFRGSQPGTIAGPWQAIVVGTSPLGNPAFASTNLQVGIQTYVGDLTVSEKEIPQSAVENNGIYSLYQVYAPNITIKGVNVSIYDSVLGNLTAIDSTIFVSSSSMSRINSINSTLVIVGSTIRGSTIALQSYNSNVSLINSVVNSTEYGFNASGGLISIKGTSVLSPELSTLSQAISKPELNPNIYSSYQLINVTISPYIPPVSLYLNGQPQSFTFNEVNKSLVLHIPFNASSLPSGTYTYNLVLRNGLEYNVSFQVNNYYPEAVLHSQITDLEIVVVVLFIILVIAIIFMRVRK